MLDVLKADPQFVLGFALVLSRVTAFLFSSALFSLTNVSMPLRILLSLLLTIVIYPLVINDSFRVQWNDFEYLALCAAEILKGLILGFLTRFFFFVCSAFGEFLSVTMGLNSSQLFNPHMGTQGSSMEQFIAILGTVFFLSLNGHHYLINYLVHSYSVWTVGGGFSGLSNLISIASESGELVWLAIKLCAPILVALLIVNIAMGVLGKAVPQLNVLVSSFPVTILVGFILLIISFPLMVDQWHVALDWSISEAFSVLKAGK